ncbi:MAG: hypothetical protein QNJ78_11315 [Gammaproteobacteria bacterium]|nr:hypothetical protein [Gammaproteobacteria bacterium]
MFGLFEKKALLETASADWLFEAFAWSLENFDANLFYHHTQLILPTNQFFPGRVDNVDGMANLIFDRVKQYAGVSHWPTRLADQSSCAILNAPQVEIKGALRGPDGIPDESVTEERRLQIPYNPQQINNPEGMIASFAHTLSHYLGQMARTPPPGGVEYWPHITELLAVYLGFGLMFANSAFTFRGGCGSCYNPHANRDAYLSEREATYALAIFAVLKDVPNASVTGHLKSHLRGFYKKAVKEIIHRRQDLEHLGKLSDQQQTPGASLASSVSSRQ